MRDRAGQTALSKTMNQTSEDSSNAVQLDKVEQLMPTHKEELMTREEILNELTKSSRKAKLERVRAEAEQECKQLSTILAL